MSDDAARPHLWDHPAWATGMPMGASDREGLLERRRTQTLPRRLEKLLEMSPSEARERVVGRGRLGAVVLGVLSEWGFATAAQIAELTGFRRSDVRAMCFDLLAAGWVKHGRAGYHHESWMAAEFWSLAETFTNDWLAERWDTATMVEVFAGRPLGTVTRAGTHRARHDLFAFDVALDIAARSPRIATIVGPGSALPAAVLDVDMERRGAVADMMLVRDDGHLIFVECGLAVDGGERRMRFYLGLVDARGPDAFTVVFLDIHHPHERRDRNQPERTLAATLEGALVGDRLRPFVFATVSEWRDRHVFFERLPVRRPTNMKVDEFTVDELCAGTADDATVLPAWVAAHRQLATSHFLLRRRGDEPLRWWDWVDPAPAVAVSEPVVSGLPTGRS